MSDKDASFLTHIDMSESEGVEKDPDEMELQMDAILKDPRRKAALLRKMGLEDSRSFDEKKQQGNGKKRQPPASILPLVGWLQMLGKDLPHHTHQRHLGLVFARLFPGYSPWAGGRGMDGQWGGWAGPPRNSGGQGASSSGLSAEEETYAGPSTSKRTREEDEEDSISLLEESEALEYVEFDPKVDPKDTWEPTPAMEKFLERHFNRSLTSDEKEAITKDFPRPNCKSLITPKLDEQVKDQLKRKGKDPHFGAEKSLFKVQEHLLEVAGPLTCLWSDLLNQNTKVNPEDTLLLLQRALVLLGSASHYVTQERRKIAWARINPKLKTLATEEYGEREANLFGPGFLEKASKRLEVEKTLSKVTNQGRPQGPPPNKRGRYENDRTDLRSFLVKGASVRGGNAKSRQTTPFTSFTRFKNHRKYNQNDTRSKFQPNPKKHSPKEKPEQ